MINVVLPWIIKFGSIKPDVTWSRLFSKYIMQLRGFAYMQVLRPSKKDAI